MMVLPDLIAEPLEGVETVPSVSVEPSLAESLVNGEIVIDAPAATETSSVRHVMVGTLELPTRTEILAVAVPAVADEAV